VLLAPSCHGSQPVQGLPGDDADEVRAWVTHLGVIDICPPQPRLLDHVLGVRGRTEHLVGDGEQQAAVCDERVVAHATSSTFVEGDAIGGTPQASDKPCSRIPKAVLLRAMKFESPTNAVSSTNPDSPSCSSNRADRSSVTAGGVWLIDSAYSMTSRSNGVKTSDRRHGGTSRAFVTSR